jgi:hypothetical protein
MTTTTITRHETATRFLTALAGRAGRGELLELRYRLADGQRMGQVFDRPDRLRGLATRAIMLGRRTDVYVGCAPRTRRHGGRDAVERAFAPWADCDGDNAVVALEAFEPAPGIVIASGSGSNCHAHWPLVEPLGRDEVERANRRLAYALGADPASADAARILRVPGTLSHKHQPPTRVDAVRLDIARSVDAADVVGSLPDPPAPARATIVPVAHRADDPLLAIAPEVYVRTLLGVDVRGTARCPARFTPTATQACMSTTPPSAAGTASAPAGGAALSTTSPHRSTSTRPAARTSCACAPNRAASSALRRRDVRPAVRLRLRRHRHPGRDDNPRVARTPSRAAGGTRRPATAIGSSPTLGSRPRMADRAATTAAWPRAWSRGMTRRALAGSAGVATVALFDVHRRGRAGLTVPAAPWAGRSCCTPSARTAGSHRRRGGHRRPSRPSPTADQGCRRAVCATKPARRTTPPRRWPSCRSRSTSSPGSWAR